MTTEEMLRQWREKKQAAREKRTGIPTKEKAGRPKGYVVTAATRAKIKAAKAAVKAARRVCYAAICATMADNCHSCPETISC